MADKDRLDVYATSFSSVTDAEKALATVEQLYKNGAVGTLDAAVIDKENGKPHVVKRLDRPRIRVIPEWFGGGALPTRSSMRRLRNSQLTRQGFSWSAASPPSRRHSTRRLPVRPRSPSTR